MGDQLEDLAAILNDAGFIASRDEAAELIAVASGDREHLDQLVQRRLSGEPLGWITGRAEFCGVEVHISPGVYEPRWQSEPLARRAAQRLPRNGTAVDICTGSGALARFMAVSSPSARILATDIDERAVACARLNRIEAYCGDLFTPLPRGLHGHVDVVVGVVPYVPSCSMQYLPRDTFVFESAASYDGGPDGTSILRRAITESPKFLTHGGALLLELGGDQPDSVDEVLEQSGFVDVEVLCDGDGDVRGIEATLS